MCLRRSICNIQLEREFKTRRLHWFRERKRRTDVIDNVVCVLHTIQIIWRVQFVVRSFARPNYLYWFTITSRPLSRSCGSVYYHNYRMLTRTSNRATEIMSYNEQRSLPYINYTLLYYCKYYYRDSTFVTSATSVIHRSAHDLPGRQSTGRVRRGRNVRSKTHVVRHDSFSWRNGHDGRPA